MKTKLTIILILFSMSIPIYASQLNKRKLFSLSLNSGYGITKKETGGLTNTTGSYVNKMRSGFAWEGNFSIQPSRIFGLGILYSHYISKGTYDEGSDHVTIKYIAPQIFFALIQTADWNLKINFGAGAITYNNNSDVFGKNRRVYGTGGGANIGGTLEYKFSEMFGVHLDVSRIVCGLFTGANVDYHNEEIWVETSSVHRFEYSRFNIGLGVTLHF